MRLEAVILPRSHQLFTGNFRTYERPLITNRSFSLTWSVAPVGWWNNTKYLNKKELIPVPYTNMAAISLFWYTNMAAVTSDENDLFIWTIRVLSRQKRETVKTSLTCQQYHSKFVLVKQYGHHWHNLSYRMTYPVLSFQINHPSI
jgi:hypothetical protein